MLTARPVDTLTGVPSMPHWVPLFRTGGKLATFHSIMPW